MAAQRKPRKPTTRKTAPKRVTPRRKTGTATKKTITRTSSPAPRKDTSLRGIIQKYRKQLQGTQVQVLTVPWEAQFLARNLGVKRHPDLKYYIHEGGVLPPQLEPYQSQDYSYERWIEDSLNGKIKPVLPPKSLMKPRKHQIQAIRKIAASHKNGWNGFILADNVGVGKTISAVIGAYEVAKQQGYTPQKKAKVLIVAPKSVLPHWRNTIKATGINNMRIVVINYDQSKKLLDPPASIHTVKKTSTINRHTIEKGTPSVDWDIIIADESHKLKNVSQRSTVFARVAKYASTTAKPFVIWCSATIGQTPLEVGYLSPLLGQMTGTKGLTPENWGAWLTDNGYNVEKKGQNYQWLKPGSKTPPEEKAKILKKQEQDVTKISELLFNPTAPSIRRNPEDIMGWPTQTYTPTPLELSKEDSRLYEQAWREFRQYIGLNPRGKNPQGGLAAQTRFRQKASLISAISTAEFVNDLLDNNIQVALSVEFIETLDVIKTYLEKKGWHCSELSGRTENEREQERIRFQKGETQVALFTIKEAISLHAGEQLSDGTTATKTKRAMVVHDIRYSALDMIQIIGRTTRDGQLANAYLMFTEGTIETKILDVVLQRMKNVSALSGDDEETQEIIQNLIDTI